MAVVRGGAAAGATGPAAAATCPLADWQWPPTLSYHTTHHTPYTLHRLHTTPTPHTGEGVSRAGLGSVEAAVTQPSPGPTTEPAQGSRRLRPGPGRRQGRRGEIFHGGTFHGRL